MRNILITVAAWTCAIAIVLWQRVLWPGIKSLLPGIEELFSAPESTESPAPVRTPDVQPAPLALDTLVVERCKPAAPRRSPRKTATPAAGFAH
jgi:hypothetical protein